LSITLGLFLAWGFGSLALGAENENPLLGTWKLISMMDEEGNKIDAPPGLKVTIEKDKMTHEVGGKKQTATIKVDATKTPAQIDVMAPGPDGATHLQPGIFKVEGDKLTLCVAAMHVSVSGKPETPNPATVTVKVDDRPTAFDNKTGAVMILERVKE
jgi:uncharacterized protein (TIGR03067 family)